MCLAPLAKINVRMRAAHAATEQSEL